MLDEGVWWEYLASEPSRSFYVFQGGPVNVSFSLIHSVDREGGAKLLWGFHSEVRGYDEVKPGDMVFLYATKPIGTIVASGFVVEKFEDRSKFWPLDYGSGDTWPRRVWIKVDYICVKEDVMGLLRECSQCSNNNCDACERLESYYEDLRREVSEVYRAGRGSIAKINDVIAERLQGVLARHCTKVSFMPLRDVFRALVEVGRGASTRPRDLEALILMHLTAGRNVIVSGPPGSGKTRLVRGLCETLGVECSIVTGNPEWTPFDTIGGRGVDGAFRPGFITSSIIRCWRSLKGSGRPEFLVIDEINRANVDLAFGGLFTRLDVSHRDEPLIEDARGLGVADDVLIDGNLYVPYSFRILATMNSYDRAMLFKLGYALLRRFAVVEMRRNFNFKQNPEGWVEMVRDKVKTWRECDLKRSVDIQVIDRELKLSRPQFTDYALLDPTLHKALEEFGGTLEVLGELAKRLGIGDAEELLNIIHGVACRMSTELSEYNVEITEAPVADTIKFITVATLLDREHAHQHLATLIDEAVSSYVVPQLDILADRVRAERLGLMLEGGKGVKDRVEGLSKEMEGLGLTRTSTLLRRLAGGGSVL
jgi:MoxR-like ATPase